MTKGEIAKNNFMQGYNCAQAVLLAFCDDLGFDEQTALMQYHRSAAVFKRLPELEKLVHNLEKQLAELKK